MVRLYVTKKFVKGICKGLHYLDSIPGFKDADEAAKWARKHKTVPVKAIGGGDYLIVDFSFQAYKR